MDFTPLTNLFQISNLSCNARCAVDVALADDEQAHGTCWVGLVRSRVALGLCAAIDREQPQRGEQQ
jgi:hypothetical protein